MKIIIALFILSPAIIAAAQTSPMPGTVPAGVGSPLIQSPPINCTQGAASPTTATQYFDRSISVGNPIWNCGLGSDGITYGWQAPYAPSVRFYSATGVASPIVKCQAATTISAATTGAYSFNLTTLGITTLLTAQTQSVSSGGSASGLNTAYITPAPTATTVSGVVYSGTTLSLLGATLIPQAISTIVYGFFCGT